MKRHAVEHLPSVMHLDLLGHELGGERHRFFGHLSPQLSCYCCGNSGAQLFAAKASSEAWSAMLATHAGDLLELVLRCIANTAVVWCKDTTGTKMTLQ